MDNAPKQNHLTLQPGQYAKSPKQSTSRPNQVNEGKSGSNADRVRVLGVLHSIRAKQKISAVKTRENQVVRNEENEKWIEDYVDR